MRGSVGFGSSPPAGPASMSPPTTTLAAGQTAGQHSSPSTFNAHGAAARKRRLLDRVPKLVPRRSSWDVDSGTTLGTTGRAQTGGERRSAGESRQTGLFSTQGRVEWPACELLKGGMPDHEVGSQKSLF